MGLESATFIDGLVVTNPVAGDLVAQGDDHLRLIKAALKASFPSVGFARYLEQDRVDVTDGATPALWAAASNYANLLGTTAKTGFASGTAGQMKFVRLDAAMTLTHHATTLDLPTEANIVTVAGDHMLVVCRGTTSNKVIGYWRKDGKALVETEVTAADIEALTYGRHTIFIDAGSMTPTASNGAVTNEYADLAVLDFDEGDHARFKIRMPKGWDHATAFNFDVQCVVDTGASGSQTITWDLKAAALSHDDTFTGLTFGTAETATATVSANDDLLQSTESDALTPSGTPAQGDLVIFDLERTAAGTVGASVQVSLLGLSLYYDINAGNDA